MLPQAFINQLGPMEMGVVAVVAILLFGKRLPEVGRSLGKGIVEFKKGLRGIEDEFEVGMKSSSSSVPSTIADAHRPAEVAGPVVPKFEPPATAPVARVEPAHEAVQG